MRYCFYYRHPGTKNEMTQCYAVNCDEVEIPLNIRNSIVVLSGSNFCIDRNSSQYRSKLSKTKFGGRNSSLAHYCI